MASKGKIIVCVSHKGGSGRTTTTANLAYRLALGGNRVGIVDFDLGSPTLGSVLELEGMETGRDRGRGLHRFIADPYGNDDAYLTERLRADDFISVFEHSTTPGLRQEMESILGSPKAARDALVAILGEREGNFDLPNPDVLRETIVRLLDQLRGDAADLTHVFVDVRAGKDTPMRSLALAHAARDLDLQWLVFFRWTPQHVLATKVLLDELYDAGVGQESVHTVRVAWQSDEQLRTQVQATADGREGLGLWMTKQNNLTEQLDKSKGLMDDPPIDIPRSEVLLLREGILSQFDNPQLREGTLNLVNAYKRLARAVLGDHVGVA